MGKQTSVRGVAGHAGAWDLESVVAGRVELAVVREIETSLRVQSRKGLCVRDAGWARERRSWCRPCMLLGCWCVGPKFGLNNGLKISPMDLEKLIKWALSPTRMER